MQLAVITKYNKLCKLLYTILLMVLLAGNVQAEEPKATDGAWLFIESVAQSTLDTVSSEELSNEEKEQSLVKLFEDSVDTKWIAKFVMGRYWREATVEQREQYATLYHKFLLQSYVPQFRTYTDEKIILIDSSMEFENEYLVQTEIRATGEPVFRVNYKVRKYEDGSFKMFDIIAEGLSMITTQRSEFASILSRKGVEYLIGLLEKKTVAQ